MIFNSKSLVLVRKGRAFYETLYQEVFFFIHGGGVLNINIKAITNMVPPTSGKEVRKVIGVINYYHDMWPRRSHALALLSKLTSIKSNFKWTELEQDAFDEIKRIAARDTLLIYPDFNETFKIHIDARTLQLGAVKS